MSLEWFRYCTIYGTMFIRGEENVSYEFFYGKKAF